ncbi:hypothetical protein P389DRAFT_101227 [Cystobasidium minutum MCA 4210]|uniref:uncharacterized protein n=1 Tax=Cystobasidium minutum MCA 4210 TaxID=1397322 RepID=UPI0034CD1397|eukprot:jgi/Rhomi1/101227/CE101226_1311
MAGYYTPASSPSLPNNGDQPSDRFARVDSKDANSTTTPDARYTSHQPATFTYTYKHTLSDSSHTPTTTASSPTLSADTSTAASTPPTSAEDGVNGGKSIYTDLDIKASPGLKHNAFSTSSHPRMGNNGGKNGYERPPVGPMLPGGLDIIKRQPISHDGTADDEESRDQLSSLRSDASSPLLSPHRRTTTTSDASAREVPPIPTEHGSVKSPKKKNLSFFPFGKSTSKSGDAENADTSAAKNDHVVDKATKAQKTKNKDVLSCLNGKKGTKNQNPYDNASTKMRKNDMKSALNDEWVVLPRDEGNTFTAPSPALGKQSALDSTPPQAGSRSLPDALPPVSLPPTPPSKTTRIDRTTTDVDSTSSKPDLAIPKTPSPLKSRHKVLSNWRAGSPFTSASTASTKSTSPPASPPSSTAHGSTAVNGNASPASLGSNVKSPPFFLRGRKQENARKDLRDIKSPSGAYPSPNGRQQLPLTPPISPPSPTRLDQRNAKLAPIAHHWPAESHVFGAAQAVIGNATIGPHVPGFRDAAPRAPSVEPFSVPAGWKKSQGGMNTALDTAAVKVKATDPVHESSSPDGLEVNDVFDVPKSPTPPQDPRQRVYNLLAGSQSRKSSLYTSTIASSSGVSTPTQAASALPPCTGRPRLEEALLSHPRTILASILDHLSYRSFKRLTRSSARLYRATLPANDASDFAEAVRQRYLASYGYRTLPSYIKPPIHFRLKDLQAFSNGNEFTLAEFSIFANEHKRRPLELTTTRTFRESTRAFNKLAIRLRFQYQLSPSPASSPTPSVARVDLTLPLIKPYWKDYVKYDQTQVYKPGRCAMLSVWVPCENNWMTDNEVMEVEREVHRSGVWKALTKGDLVRNIALGDIANEGLLIFDGQYLRDLSYTHASIGHLPSWINSFTFSPSYFHNQIASSVSQPIVYLDLTSFAAPVQQNLLLCREKVDLASPSGEQYKVTRYVYRTVVDLLPGAILISGDGGGPTETIHPDWAGQLIIETDGTTEAAKALLQRTKSILDNGRPDQSSSAPSHSNNRPYRILRNMSRPGLIFCRVIEDGQPAQLFA